MSQKSMERGVTMISPFEELKQSRDDLFARFSRGEISDEFHEIYTDVMDQYLRRAFQDSMAGHRLFRDKRPFAFVAVGGYGRRELCLHSDIDIMVLFSSKIPALAKALSNEIFLPLWDLGFDLGCGIRNLRDCLSLCNSDFQVLTSLMDARFLCGESSIYLSLMETLQRKVIDKKAAAFAKWLEDRDEIRRETKGDSSYLLEPHIKKGIGGLRDYHHILWLAKAFFRAKVPRDLEYQGELSHREYYELLSGLRFIWLVRNHLHLLSGRKNDRLAFEYQEKIAQRLSFRDEGDLLGVEHFLGRLHASMAYVKSLHRHFLSAHVRRRKDLNERSQDVTLSEGLCLHQGELNFDSATAIISNPHLLMEIFENCSLLGYSLSREAMRLTLEFIYLVDKGFRESGLAAQGFLNIISGRYASPALDQMFETRFLEAYLPEFGDIKDRVQFDAYHIFPVGRHSLETLRGLKGLTGQKEFLLVDIFSDIKNREALFLAGLLHDIGKVGKGHALRGAAITRPILNRLGYGQKGTDDILFLVRNHLLLVETATRRDLNDEKAVVQCARIIRDEERLKMLYLLTWADSRATGPRAWSEWIANLVQELFFKVLHILERQELATPHASLKAEETRSQIRRLLADSMDSADLERNLEAMSPRYILNTMPRDIVRHIAEAERLRQEFDNNKLDSFCLGARVNDMEGCWDLTFMARDRLGLFSHVAGVLALENINILSAGIYTWRDGTAVDIFKVTSPPDPNDPERTWKKVRKDLKETFSGKLSLHARLSQKAAPSILSNNRIPTRPPEVTVDNHSSDFFTLIEIFVDDRVGLLYEITHTLFCLGLDIRIAKIATKGDQVADAFYIRDTEGQKVENEKQVEAIREALLNQLSRIE